MLRRWREYSDSQTNEFKLFEIAAVLKDHCTNETELNLTEVIILCL